MAWTEQDNRDFDRAMSESRAEYMSHQEERDRREEHEDRLINDADDDIDVRPLSSFAEEEVKRREDEEAEDAEQEVKTHRTVTTNGPIFPPNVTGGLLLIGLIAMPIAPAFGGLCLLGAVAGAVINLKD